MHVHLGGMQLIVDALQVLLVMAVLNLIAMKFADRSNLAASYCNLFGLT